MLRGSRPRAPLETVLLPAPVTFRVPLRMLPVKVTVSGGGGGRADDGGGGEDGDGAFHLVVLAKGSEKRRSVVAPRSVSVLQEGDEIGACPAG